MSDVKKGGGRHRRIRLSAPPRTKSVKDIKKAARSQIPVVTSWVDEDRPATRGSCVDLDRPCPWVMCRHHLYLDVGENGSIKFNFPDLSPLELKNTCSLDVADQGGATLDEIGNAMNLSRERIRQLESKILAKLRLIIKKI